MLRVVTDIRGKADDQLVARMMVILVRKVAVRTENRGEKMVVKKKRK